jgi:SAM-dependent methyltransferase
MTPFTENYANQYDRLYRDKNYAAECDFLETLFAQAAAPVRRILDLGCGTGGHALPLAQRGLHVTGVDLSAGMLACAQNKAHKLSVSDRIVLHHSPIQGFDCGQTFDAVTCLFAVLSYLTTNGDLLAGLQTARRHLAPGGVFIFDLWHGPAVLTDRPTERTRVIEHAGTRTLRHARPEFDFAANVVQIHYHLLELRGSEVVAETKETHAIRYLFRPELDFFCAQAGFELTAFCPFLKPGGLATERDWNVTAVARAI